MWPHRSKCLFFRQLRSKLRFVAPVALYSLARLHARPWYIVFFYMVSNLMKLFSRALRKIKLIAPCCEIVILRPQEASNNALWCIIVQHTLREALWTSFGFLIFTGNSAAELTVFWIISAFIVNHQYRSLKLASWFKSAKQHLHLCLKYRIWSDSGDTFSPMHLQCGSCGNNMFIALYS